MKLYKLSLKSSINDVECSDFIDVLAKLKGRVDDVECSDCIDVQAELNGASDCLDSAAVGLSFISCPKVQTNQKKIIVMARGRKRKNANFIPRPWIPNTSSEDEHDVEQPLQGGKLSYLPYFLFVI